VGIATAPHSEETKTKWNNMKMEHEDEKEKGEKERKGCLRATEWVRREKHAQGALSMPAP
jgi:hypothetical protein